MINIEKTFERFGYYPENITAGYKKVIHCCDNCNIERIIEYRRAISKFPYYCHSCMLKIEVNLPRKNVHIGTENFNYIDGRTINPVCKYSGCNKKINKNTPGEGGMCQKHSKLGKRNGRYIDGRTPLYQLLRGCYQYKMWAEEVRMKFNYICTYCKKENIVLDVHHYKKSFKQIVEEFLAFYSQFSPIEDKETLVRLSESWPDFWNIDNGITLCEECHTLEHSSSTMSRSE